MNTTIHLILFLSTLSFGIMIVVSSVYKRIHQNLLYPLGILCVIFAILTYQLLPSKSYGFTEVSQADILKSLIFTSSFIVIGYLSAKALKLQRFMLKELITVKSLALLLFYFIATFAQEFLFRTFIYDHLIIFFGLNFILFVIFSGILFSIAHLAYRDRLFWIFATIFGFFLSIFYYFIPNLILISLIHGIVGLLAIFFGFVRFDGKKVLL